MTLDKESDYDLIEWVELQDDFPEESKKALSILYDRYNEKLYKMLYKILSKHGLLPEDIVDLVTDTFYKIQSEKLKCHKQENSTESSFLYWLITVAKNLYYGILNEQKHKKEHFQLSYSPFEQKDHENANFAYEEKSSKYPNEEIIVDYVQNLPEREREILLSYFDYYDKEKYTPSEIMSELALRHNTSVDYIRNIRNRLKKRIFQSLSNKIRVRK